MKKDPWKLNQTSQLITFKYMICCNSKDLPRSHLFVPAALDKLTGCAYRILAVKCAQCNFEQFNLELQNLLF